MLALHPHQLFPFHSATYITRKICERTSTQEKQIKNFQKLCPCWFRTFSAPSGITRLPAPPQTRSLESSVFDAHALDYRIRLSINCSVRPTTNYPARCTVWAIPSEHLFCALVSLANRLCRGDFLQGQHAFNISAVQSQTCAVENSASNTKVPSVMPNHRAHQSPSHTSPPPVRWPPTFPPASPRRP